MILRLVLLPVYQRWRSRRTNWHGIFRKGANVRLSVFSLHLILTTSIVCRVLVGIYSPHRRFHVMPHHPPHGPNPIRSLTTNRLGTIYRIATVVLCRQGQMDLESYTALEEPDRA